MVTGAPHALAHDGRFDISRPRPEIETRALDYVRSLVDSLSGKGVRDADEIGMHLAMIGLRKVPEAMAGCAGLFAKFPDIKDRLGVARNLQEISDYTNDAAFLVVLRGAMKCSDAFMLEIHLNNKPFKGSYFSTHPEMPSYNPSEQYHEQLLRMIRKDQSDS